MKKMVSVISIVFLVLLFFAVGNGHASQLQIGGTFSYIHSLVNGGGDTVEGGGSIEPSYLDGRLLPYLYCVGLFTTINVPGTYTADVNNAGTGIHNAGEIAYLLGKYGTGGQGDNAIALQAAIWTVEYDNSAGQSYFLDSAYYSGSNPSLVTLYDSYVSDAAGKAGDISAFDWINPYSGETPLQQLVTTPEPGTMMLLGAGVLGLAVFGKRRMNKKV